MDYLAVTPFPFFNTRRLGAVAGTTNTITTTVASEHAINGEFGVPLGILTNSATVPVLDANSGAAFITQVSSAVTGGQACRYVFGVNAAGVLRAVQGQITPTEIGVTTTPGAFILSPGMPGIPDDFCPVASVIVRTSPTGNSFTFGTTSWAAAGITSTVFKNLQSLPGRLTVL